MTRNDALIRDVDVTGSRETRRDCVSTRMTREARHQTYEISLWRQRVDYPGSRVWRSGSSDPTWHFVTLCDITCLITCELNPQRQRLVIDAAGGAVLCGKEDLRDRICTLRSRDVRCEDLSAQGWRKGSRTGYNHVTQITWWDKCMTTKRPPLTPCCQLSSASLSASKCQV